MRRASIAIAAVAAAALAVVLPGCGQSEKDRYIEAYSPLNTRLVRLNNTLATTINSSGNKSAGQIGREFRPIGSQLAALSKQIRGLDTPTDLEQESRALTDTLDRTRKRVMDLTDAASSNDAGGLASASTQLPAAANRISPAANKLARATGANVGS